LSKPSDRHLPTYTADLLRVSPRHHGHNQDTARAADAARHTPPAESLAIVAELSARFADDRRDKITRKRQQRKLSS
jgi:hypothetical protein